MEHRWEGGVGNKGAGMIGRGVEWGQRVEGGMWARRRMIINTKDLWECHKKTHILILFLFAYWSAFSDGESDHFSHSVFLSESVYTKLAILICFKIG